MQESLLRQKDYRWQTATEQKTAKIGQQKRTTVHEFVQKFVCFPYLVESVVDDLQFGGRLMRSKNWLVW